MSYKKYKVSAHHRRPLIEFICGALERCECRIIKASEPDVAPFRVTFETRDGERLGIVVYAFLANSKPTTNRPMDEHRFQLKYGSKTTKNRHVLWQDPYGLYTTLLCGINTEQGFFVAADPVLHSPTRFFISVEFKERDAQDVLRSGWSSWERDRRSVRGFEEPAEVLVGGTADSFLRYVRFEREALGEGPGHRQLLAELAARPGGIGRASVPNLAGTPPPARLHELAEEFELSVGEVLDLIQSARRLKMAVRGYVAEEHLVRSLRIVPGVSDVQHLDAEGSPDVSVRFEGSRPLTVECKNALRKTLVDGTIRVDLQRTRTSKKDPCSRYYRRDAFDVVAACIHSVTERWEFRYALTSELDPHKKCEGRVSNNVRVDKRWLEDARTVLGRAAAAS
ncbi:MAG: hypothetical protein JKY65_07600 [Planctomycetes bacterium]|nr:hypothetical protein [Planctomycetota bacterium]